MRSVPALMMVIVLYFAGAVFACQFGRVDGGVSLIWLPGAIMAGWLVVPGQRHRVLALSGCAVAQELAAGWFGLGWTAGIFLCAASLGEACAAALLARHTLRSEWPVTSLPKVAIFLIGAGVAIPVCSGVVSATAVHLIVGIGLVPLFRTWVLGHGVGMIAVLPFVLTLTTRLSRWGGALLERRSDTLSSAAMRLGPVQRRRASTLSALLVVASMVVMNACVFTQTIRLPLVAPLLFALFAAVWADALVATAMPMIVATIAAPLTALGLGPIAPGLMLASDRLQLGLLYAGLVACCTLPVVAEQARRRREMATLQRNAAQFKVLSQRADDLIDELRKVAMTDPLTGLPNRRAFFDALTEQGAMAEPACVAMIDIDHFKRVNDQLGHAAGDTVLRHFAVFARNAFRTSDLVARIGGEEFAVILRGVGLEQALPICQRLVDGIATTEIMTDHGKVCVTISTGLCEIADDGVAAMGRADHALYQAKRGGRSRLTTAA